MGWARLAALLLLLTALAHPGDGLCFEWIWEKGYGTEAGNLLIYTDPLILTYFCCSKHRWLWRGVANNLPVRRQEGADVVGRRLGVGYGTLVRCPLKNDAHDSVLAKP